MLEIGAKIGQIAEKTDHRQNDCQIDCHKSKCLCLVRQGTVVQHVLTMNKTAPFAMQHSQTFLQPTSNDKSFQRQHECIKQR